MNLSLIILAGGKSSRMGTDKGLLSFRGKPMVQHIFDNLCSHFQDTIIVCNNNIYKQFEKTIITDNHNSLGPLGGIEAGLSKSKTEHNIIVSCDSPFVTIDLISYMSAHFFSSQVIFLKKEGIHPFPGYYSKKILPSINRMIENEDLKIMNLMNYCSVLTLDCSAYNSKLFINFNTSKQIRKFDEASS